MDEDIIWKGHDKHITMMKYHLISLILFIIIISISIKIDFKFLSLLVIPFLLSYSKYKAILRDSFEINSKRLVMVHFKKGKYKTHEIELYDVKHLVLEQKANGKGYIIFKTMSSKFEEVITPCMNNPKEIHNIIRDIVEDLKLNRNKILSSDIE